MIYVVGGPTGSGKTALAVTLANHWQVPLINADAFQMYQGMDIGTNKEREIYGQNLPYLFDHLSPSEPTTVAAYQNAARPLIERLLKQHPHLIMVGGTGLYLKATLYDFHFAEHQQPVDLTRFDQLTNTQLHDYLASIDPHTSASIHPANRRRVLRAIAIYLQTGKTKSEVEAKQQKQPIYPCQFIGIDLPRATLYTRIDQRVEKMFQAGLVEEVAGLLAKHHDTSYAFQAIGYKEVIAYLRQQRTLEETKLAVALATRRYAKRQLTYFRHQFPMHWYSSLADAMKDLLS